MFKRAYIINFEKGNPFDNFNYKDFHNTLTSAKGILDWWHYLETTYIVITEQNVLASDIGEFMRQIAPKKRLFICELNLRNHDGLLQKDAWDWINKYNMNIRL